MPQEVSCPWLLYGLFAGKGHMLTEHRKKSTLSAGKDRRQEEKGTTENEMVGWHHQLNGREFG